MADPLGVSIAFDNMPLDPDPTWTRIDTLEGCRVRDWSIDRGRPTEFDKTDAGTAVVHIIDREGIFDPTNPSGAYYPVGPYGGGVLPGRQAAISLRNPVTDTWFTLFRGFVESWFYRLDPTRQYQELELQLVDGFAWLSRAELKVGEDGALPLPAEVAAGNVGYGLTLGTLSDRIQAILDDVNWPAEWREESIDVFSGNVRVGPKSYGPGTSALDAVWDAVDAEFPGVGNCWMSKSGHFIFHGRQARFRPDVAEYGIQRRTCGDPNHRVEGAVPISELEWSNGSDNIYNAASATPQGILNEDGSWRMLNPDPPDNDDVAGQYYDSPESIEFYGRRSITFDQLQTVYGIHAGGGAGNDALAETKQFAVYYVQNYSSAPAIRISRMVFKSRRPEAPLAPALWSHLCECEISDLLTVQTSHPGDGGLNYDFYVEGLHYTARPGPPEYPIVELSLDLSPRANWTTNPFDEDPDP